jgi:hypothetical protein
MTTPNPTPWWRRAWFTTAVSGVAVTVIATLITDLLGLIPNVLPWHHSGGSSRAKPAISQSANPGTASVSGGATSTDRQVGPRPSSRKPTPSASKAPKAHKPATTKNVVDASADPDLPYVVTAPAPHGISGEEPLVEFSVQSVLNRGKPVPISVSGSGFFANSSVSLEWSGPDGGTYFGTSLPTTDRGLFQTTLTWLPLQYLGTQGNDGAWKIRFEDQTSGKVQNAQIDVRSDESTPSPDQWTTRDTWNPKPYGPAEVEAGTSGKLCKGDGAMSELNISGFTPEASLEIDFLRADGERVEARGEQADGVGKVAMVQDYWATQACGSSSDFTYTVKVTEAGTGRTAQSDLLFTTR